MPTRIAASCIAALTSSCRSRSLGLEWSTVLPTASGLSVVSQKMLLLWSSINASRKTCVGNSERSSWRQSRWAQIESETVLGFGFPNGNSDQLKSSSKFEGVNAGPMGRICTSSMVWSCDGGIVVVKDAASRALKAFCQGEAAFFCRCEGRSLPACESFPLCQRTYFSRGCSS